MAINILPDAANIQFTLLLQLLVDFYGQHFVRASFFFFSLARLWFG